MGTLVSIACYHVAKFSLSLTEFAGISSFFRLIYIQQKLGVMLAYIR